MISQISACSKSVSEQSFSCKEKRWVLPSCYKSENSESVCNLYARQIYDEGKRLHLHNRFEGRLFYSTSRQIMSSFSEVFYGKGISANA